MRENFAKLGTTGKRVIVGGDSAGTFHAYSEVSVLHNFIYSLLDQT
jgi:hypothetical protein